MAQADCPKLEASLWLVEVTFEARDFPSALQAHRQASQALACGPVPSRTQLVRYWLADGGLNYVQDRRNAAVASLTAASQLDPGVWLMAYGDDLRRLYEGASVGVSGTGQIDLESALPAGQRAWVDAVQVELPVTVDAGVHLLQLVEGRRAVYAQVVLVPEDEHVTVVLPELAPEPRRARRDKDGSKRPSALLVGAGAAAVLSGAAAGGALSQNGAMKRADSIQAVEAAYGRQVGFAVTSTGLAGLAATGLVLHVVL